MFVNTLIFDKNLTLLQKAEEAEKYVLDNIFKQFIVDRVIIEEAFMAISSGGSAYVTSLLQRFNGMISFMIYQHCRNILFLSPHTARKLLGIKLTRGQKTLQKKKFIVEFIENYFKGKFVAKKTKNGNPVAGQDDIADSLVLSLCGVKFCDSLMANADSKD